MDNPINFYEEIPREYLKPIATYKNQKQIGLDLPVRINVVGSSGSGKTQCVMNLIKFFNCFNRVYLFVGDDNEALYHYLIDCVRKTCGKNNIFVSNTLDDVPEIHEFDPSYNNLVIIDDLINEKNNKDINALNLFTNGRKQNVSVIYVSQDYFKINKTLRKNCNVICLCRFDDQKDLQLILSKIKGNLSGDEMRRVYDYATSGGKQYFLTIDTNGNSQTKFRRCLKPIPLGVE